MSGVQSTLNGIFEQTTKSFCSVNPEEAVAVGAAVQDGVLPADVIDV